MRASKYGVLCASLLGLIATVLPVGNGQHGWITFWSLLRGGGLSSVLTLFAFVPFFVLLALALYSLRARSFEGVWTCMCAMASAFGLIVLGIGVAMLHVGGSDVAFAPAAFVIAGLGAVIAFVCGAVADIRPQHRNSGFAF